jgi:hypothetical protein
MIASLWARSIEVALRNEGEELWVWNSDWNSGLNVLLDTLIGGSVFNFLDVLLRPRRAYGPPIEWKKQ